MLLFGVDSVVCLIYPNVTLTGKEKGREKIVGVSHDGHRSQFVVSESAYACVCSRLFEVSSKLQSAGPKNESLSAIACAQPPSSLMIFINYVYFKFWMGLTGNLAKKTYPYSTDSSQR